MDEENKELLHTSALFYAKGFGFMEPTAVFPLNGKTPAISKENGGNGSYDATTDKDTIDKWWSGTYSGCNIGIATGERNGIVVLDVDHDDDKGIDGSLTLAIAEKELGELPETWTVNTPRGGLHLYFKYPTGHSISIGTNIFKGTYGDGIDYRGNGGHVVAPPSFHPDNGRQYEWDTALKPRELPIAELPEAWVNVLSKNEQTISEKFALPDKVEQGSRNETMFKYACQLRGAGKKATDIRQQMERVNRERFSPALGQDELNAIFNSAMNYKTNEEKQTVNKPALQPESCPAWIIDPVSRSVNEPVLAKTVIDKYHLSRSSYGNMIVDQDGKRYSDDDVKNCILLEITDIIVSQPWRVATSCFRTLKLLLKEKKTVLPEKKQSSFTQRELFSMTFKDPVFVVNELIPCGLCALGAPPKTGKSFLCLQLANAVAKGDTFFGRQTNKGSVLYYALEDNDRRLKNRLIKMGETGTDSIRYITRTDLSLESGLIDEMRDWVKTTPDARMIFVDTVGRVKGKTATGGTLYEADTTLFGPLQSFAIDSNVCVFLVTHLTKQKAFKPDDDFERLTGSMGLGGVADALYMIDGKRFDKDGKTLKTSGREIEQNEYGIHFDKDKLRWVCDGNTEETEKQAAIDNFCANHFARTIIHYVEKFGEWEVSVYDLIDKTIELTGSAEYCTATAVGKMLHESDFCNMLQQRNGIVCNQGNGGRNGRSYHFKKYQEPII